MAIHPDIDPDRDRRVGGGARGRHPQRRARPRAPAARGGLRRRAPARPAPGRGPEHAVRQHDPGRGRGRRSRATTSSSAEYAALVRWNAIAMVLQRQQGVLASSAATSPATSRPRRSTRSASTTSGTRRPSEHGGDLVFIQGHSSPGHLRARVPRGPAHRGADAPLPAGGRRRRALVATRTRG